MKVVLLDEAQRRFEAEDEWWREHRDAKELFVEEFAQTIEQLSSIPGSGQRYRLARGKLIQRVLMKTAVVRIMTSGEYLEMVVAF